MIFKSTKHRYHKGDKKKRGFIFFILLTIASHSVYAQTKNTSLINASLQNLIDYAIAHQPLVQQASINQDVTELQIKNRLADWYPQVNFNYNYQRNFELPVNIIGGNHVRFGVNNTSALQLTATQNIFNKNALLASHTKNDLKLVASKQTENAKINLISDVSKNYYDILATQEQLKITGQTIIMLSGSLKDARARYDAGVADKTDYHRATIALNNAIASKKGIEQTLYAKIADLKYLVGYPAKEDLSFSHDSIAFAQEIYLDTSRPASYTSRVEYQQLQAQLRLQEANVKYNKWSYIPTISANGAYIRNFLNDNFSKLYSQSFPSSYAALTLGFPIFQGGKRKNNIKIAERQVDQARLSLVNFVNLASSEYETAIAQYKASMANFVALKENVKMAEEVHRIIALQYREGIKNYLELITAQTDLLAAQINYYNAMYSLLSSKIDVQKAEGTIDIP